MRRLASCTEPSQRIWILLCKIQNSSAEVKNPGAAMAVRIPSFDLYDDIAPEAVAHNPFVDSKLGAVEVLYWSGFPAIGGCGAAKEAQSTSSADRGFPARPSLRPRTVRSRSIGFLAKTWLV